MVHRARLGLERAALHGVQVSNALISAVLMPLIVGVPKAQVRLITHKTM